jgi:hypothetical protein
MSPVVASIGGYPESSMDRYGSCAVVRSSDRKFDPRSALRARIRMAIEARSLWMLVLSGSASAVSRSLGAGSTASAFRVAGSDRP